jgi:3-(3-hydroxy-phenyl)propionate hydroxylase
VLRGAAPRALLNTYGAEREYAADENLLNSTRATDFITPKSAISRLFRDAALDLARTHPFARRMVNSGRLSVPATLHGSALNTPDCDSFAGPMVPGAPAADAPLADGSWLLRQLPGHSFSAILFGAGTKAAGLVHAGAQGIAPIQVLSLPADGAAAERYDARPGTVYLLRPDQHVCARWRSPNAQDIASALKRAMALN